MRTFFATLICCLLLSSFAFATDPAKEGGMEMQAMMEKWQKLSTPGAEHAVFTKSVGDWTYKSKIWMEPGQPPQLSAGTRTVSTTHGGRFMKFEDTGDMMGMTFHGMGIMGFDNYNKVYQMFWIDDMGTAMYTAEGTASADGKTITMMGTMDDCIMEKKDVPVKYVWTMTGDTEQHFEIWNAAGTPEEMKTMEIHYTKK